MESIKRLSQDTVEIDNEIYTKLPSGASVLKQILDQMAEFYFQYGAFLGSKPPISKPDEPQG